MPPRRSLRTLYSALACVTALAVVPAVAPSAQGNRDTSDARRLASVVAVAVEEYGKGIDSRGALISTDEYAETTGFLDDAREIAQRLTGPYAVATRATLDTLIEAVREKRPPTVLRTIHTRFVQALGVAGAMEPGLNGAATISIPPCPAALARIAGLRRRVPRRVDP